MTLLLPEGNRCVTLITRPSWLSTFARTVAIRIANGYGISTKTTGICIAASVVRMGDGKFSLVKAAGGGISEMRLDLGPGYRVYFGRDGAELVFLLGGGSKKGQQQAIEAAKELWREYKKRKQARAAADSELQ